MNKKDWFDMVKVGDILVVPPKSHISINSLYGVDKVVVVNIENRVISNPLLTVVTPSLTIHRIDIGHFYVEPEQEEFTLAEVCDMLGRDIKIKK